MPSTTTQTHRFLTTTWLAEGPTPSLLAPPQPWDGLAEPRSSAPKLPDLARIFAVDAAKRAGYVDHNGRLALLAGGRDANGGGPWRTEGVCVLYALRLDDLRSGGDIDLADTEPAVAAGAFGERELITARHGGNPIRDTCGTVGQ